MPSDGGTASGDVGSASEPRDGDAAVLEVAPAAEPGDGDAAALEVTPAAEPRDGDAAALELSPGWTVRGEPSGVDLAAAPPGRPSHGSVLSRSDNPDPFELTYPAEHPGEYPDPQGDDERLLREVPPHY